MDNYLGKEISSYKLTAFIGEGGMASVYEGTHLRLGNKVVVKILNPSYTARPEIRSRFENEAKALANLKHSSIVKVIDYIETEGLLAIVMERLDGQDLSELLSSEGKLSLERAVKLFSQLLDAFAYAHGKGIVHRDIKPSNIFVDAQDHATILDFGIAKLLDASSNITVTGVAIGTSLYMSPEQVKYAKISEAHYLRQILRNAHKRTQQPFDETSDKSASRLCMLQEQLQANILDIEEALPDFNKMRDAEIFSLDKELSIYVSDVYEAMADVGAVVQQALSDALLDKNHIDHRTDIYSLGVTLLACVTGHAPYDSQNESAFEIQTRIVSEVLPINTGHSGLDAVIAKATAKKVENRYQTAAEFKAALQGLTTPQTNYAPPQNKSIPKPAAEEVTVVDNGKVIAEKPLLVIDNAPQPEEKPLFEVYKQGKKGFVDANGKQVIPCIYDNVRPFFEGLALVRKGEKWGYINKNGKEVTPCIYDYVDNFFFEGLALVRKGEKWGYINKNGKEVTPCIYNSARHFSEGLAAVAKYTWWGWGDSQSGFIDKNGKEVIPLQYDSSSSFREGLASVKKGEKWGFIDKNGNQVIPCIYDWAYSFNEGLAAVCIGDKWGFIDKNGNEVILGLYDKAEFFSKGIAKVKKEDRIFFINKQGEEVE